jgi:hypothetical protein
MSRLYGTVVWGFLTHNKTIQTVIISYAAIFEARLDSTTIMPRCPALGWQCDEGCMSIKIGTHVCSGCQNDVHTECGLEDPDKLGVALLEKHRVTCLRCLENPGSNTGGGAADTRNYNVVSKSIASTTSRKRRASAEPVARKLPPAKASMPAAKKRRTSNGGSNDLQQIFANFRQLGEERYREARGVKCKPTSPIITSTAKWRLKKLKPMHGQTKAL